MNTFDDTIDITCELSSRRKRSRRRGERFRGRKRREWTSRRTS